MNKTVRINMLILLLSISAISSVFSQKSLQTRKWTELANKMPEEWYGSEEALRIAENVLLFQRNIGGWPKNTQMQRVLNPIQCDSLNKAKENRDAIFDNGATTTEIRFLTKVYNAHPDSRYKKSILNGVDYLLQAQYPNGGWPMFYPIHPGYYTHITFNDDATAHLMNLLKEIYTPDPLFSKITDSNLSERAKKAWDKGIECILKTQIVVHGKPTIWCAQHDENTFLPAKARSYELPSFSGSESVGLIELLMDIEKPSKEIIASVEGAIEWLKAHELKNTRWDNFINKEGKPDRRIVNDPKAGSMWARFYDLETGQPYVCDRDGIKKKTLEEIGYERRNGYSWYVDSPITVIKKYPVWKKRIKMMSND